MGPGDLGNAQNRKVLTLPAAEEAAAAKPSCGGCQCFVAPPERPEGVDAAQWAQQFKHLGRCHRFPTTVPKAPEDFCFDFLAKEDPSDAR